MTVLCAYRLNGADDDETGKYLKRVSKQIIEMYEENDDEEGLISFIQMNIASNKGLEYAMDVAQRKDWTIASAYIIDKMKSINAVIITDLCGSVFLKHKTGSHVSYRSYTKKGTNYCKRPSASGKKIWDSNPDIATTISHLLCCLYNQYTIFTEYCKLFRDFLLYLFLSILRKKTTKKGEIYYGDH